MSDRSWNDSWEIASNWVFRKPQPLPYSLPRKSLTKILNTPTLITYSAYSLLALTFFTSTYRLWVKLSNGSRFHLQSSMGKGKLKCLAAKQEVKPFWISILRSASQNPIPVKQGENNQLQSVKYCTSCLAAKQEVKLFRTSPLFCIPRNSLPDKAAQINQYMTGKYWHFFFGLFWRSEVWTVTLTSSKRQTFPYPN